MINAYVAEEKDRTEPQFSRICDLMAVGLDNCVVNLIDFRQRRVLRTMHGHQHYIWAVQLNVDKEMIVSASSDHMIKIWHYPSESLTRTIVGHNGIVFDLHVDWCRDMILSCGSDKAVTLWNLQTGQLLFLPHVFVPLCCFYKSTRAVFIFVRLSYSNYGQSLR